jgi:lipopolysaccharide/colanic/teichoic acid biosynthesis glycosyltransferase
LIVGLFILLVSTPFLLIVSLVLYLANLGSPFFVQLRPSKKGKIFKIIKFKTMNDKKDKNGNLLPDAERLTKVGELVRKTSMDELPKLINVVKGENCMIGPRPLLPQYLPLYTTEQARSHEVKPGITGWAQVNGPNAISWEKKFEYDVWYVNNISFLLECKILYLTIKKVFKREDITAVNSVSAEAFKGNIV